MTATQPELSLASARHTRPMVKRDGAQNILDLEEWQLDLRIDELDGIVNVASANCARLDLRFAVVCLVENKRGLKIPRADAELLELIFGRPRPLVRAQWIYSRLMISPAHFYDLAREGVIKLARGSEQRGGPGGSAIVEWTALERFIRNRRAA